MHSNEEIARNPSRTNLRELTLILTEQSILTF